MLNKNKIEFYQKVNLYVLLLLTLLIFGNLKIILITVKKYIKFYFLYL